MSNTPSSPVAAQDISPKGSPKSKAMMPGDLANVLKNREKRTRQASNKIRVQLEKAKSAQKSTEDEAKVAELGIKLAKKDQDVIRIKRKRVHLQEELGKITADQANDQQQDLKQRFFSAGDDLWRHEKTKARIEETGTVQLLDPRQGVIGESLLALYRKNDQLGQGRKRNKLLRTQAVKYYDAEHPDPGNQNTRLWCHVTGRWNHESQIKVAHIVPFFVVSFGSICELLFGSKSDEVDKMQNTLVLGNHVKYWFDRHELLIVPWDATENPITRWRTDVIPGIHAVDLNLPNMLTFGDLDGKELSFRNQNRPAARFLYFHFIMSLIRLKDLKKEGWQKIWARYYEQRPFPTPGPYMRKSMILALATHFELTDMETIESWIVGNGFDVPINTPLATETARQVHMVIEDEHIQQQKTEKRQDFSEEEGEEIETDEEHESDKRDEEE